MTLLKTEELSKNFRRGMETVHAVREVSFEVGAGERVYIHGPSGAGKSTFLHVIGALARPTGGKVFLKGKNIYTMSDRRRSALRNRSFGFIFQFYYLLPELNVLENVMLPARIKGGESSGRIKARAVDIIERIRMKERIKHRPGQLSGGEAQRVAIARALINSPDLLLCDEPTGNLDSEMSENIYRLLLDISSERKMSVVVVSHQDVVKGFYHTEYFMKDGMLFKMGSAVPGQASVSGSKLRFPALMPEEKRKDNYGLKDLS